MLDAREVDDGWCWEKGRGKWGDLLGLVRTSGSSTGVSSFPTDLFRSRRVRSCFFSPNCYPSCDSNPELLASEMGSSLSFLSPNLFHS